MPDSRHQRLLFRGLFRIARFFDLAGRAVFYFAAGTLRRTDLESMFAIAWEDFAADPAVVGSGLMSWERAIVQEFLKPEDRVLVVGSGSGRDLLALRQAGHDVVGVEQAAPAVERARRLFRDHGVSAEMIAARFDQAALPGTFDAIVFSWFCYCYILGAAERTAALAKARAHLNPAGRVIVSYIAADASPRTRAVNIARAASRLTGADWRAEPNDHFYPVAGGRPLFAFQHSFRPDEVEQEARNAGLSVLASRRFPEAFVVVLSPDAVERV
jgi:SAM-dependent methyltransferase